MKQFRDLRADEIDVRVATDGAKFGSGGCSLLLYKDARCDMNILDETVGAENWQREHYECKGNLFCRVGISFNENDWVWKSDCGKESATESQKGDASDSFKRACFNWGIGRELYTAPSIWINEGFLKRDNKGKIKSRFFVKAISIVDKKIVSLEIADSSTKTVVFATAKKAESKPSYMTDKPKDATEAMSFIGCLVNVTKTKMADIEKYYGGSMNKWTDAQLEDCIKNLRSKLK